MSKLNFITPFFIVSNLKDSVAYYVDKLGFEVKDADGYVLFFGKPQKAE